MLKIKLDGAVNMTLERVKKLELVHSAAEGWDVPEPLGSLRFKFVLDEVTKQPLVDLIRQDVYVRKQFISELHRIAAEEREIFGNGRKLEDGDCEYFFCENMIRWIFITQIQ